MEQTELIEKCRQGDRQALNQLYTQYRPQLLRICRQYTDDNHVAEDLLHDAFVIILTSLDRLRSADRLLPWMVAITRNVGYHYVQHVKEEQAVLRQMATEVHEDGAESMVQDYDYLQQLVAHLPEGYQRVFRLSVFEGLSHQEIGQLLGIAPHSSSSQLYHAKQMLRALARRSWLLLLLLVIVIPTLLLWRRQPKAIAPKVATTITKTATADSSESKPLERTIPTATRVYTTPDTVSVLAQEQELSADSLPQPPESPAPDTIHHSPMPNIGPSSTTQQLAHTPKPPHSQSPWNVMLAYSGTLGVRDNFNTPAEIHAGSFHAVSNSNIMTDSPISNWIDYSNYLYENNEATDMTTETRSLMNIAEQNSLINGGEMEAHHEHQLPISIQLTLSRQLTERLSIETGLSYTQLKSVTTTGSQQAYIEERQRLRYIGIPLRINYQWYCQTPFRFYTSVGTMLELPLRPTLDILHMTSSESVIFRHEDQHLSVPPQWSATIGFGAQYDLTPHLGVYIEPSLQYFFRDGSDLKSYRTEHPLTVTLPLGLRFHW